jgi:ketosteroid isomerase-like protein
MQMKTVGALAASAMLAACSAVAPLPARDAQQQVFAAERAFARSMAERNLAAFSTFISDEAIFYTGPRPLRGKADVVGWWSRYFSAPAAPFSWEPDDVQVLESGTLALSTGPVRNAQGELTARFNSVWRREAGGWRVVFDKGSPLPPRTAPGSPQ